MPTHRLLDDNLNPEARRAINGYLLKIGAAAGLINIAALLGIYHTVSDTVAAQCQKAAMEQVSSQLEARSKDLADRQAQLADQIRQGSADCSKLQGRLEEDSKMIGMRETSMLSQIDSFNKSLQNTDAYKINQAARLVDSLGSHSDVKEFLATKSDLEKEISDLRDETTELKNEFSSLKTLAQSSPKPTSTVTVPPVVPDSKPPPDSVDPSKP